jgi:hypothetical protein
MSAHIVNTFTEKMNRRRKLRLSSDGTGTLRVLRAINIANSAGNIATEMCGKALKAFEYRTNIMRATEGAEVEEQ